MAFGFSHTHRYSQRGRRGGAGGSNPTLPPCGQLTRCFSAVAEVLVDTDNTHHTEHLCVPACSMLIMSIDDDDDDFKKMMECE